jgi:hypothetical protein
VAPNGGAANKKCARQTKMVVQHSRPNQQTGQINEDVVMWRPTITPAKSRSDGTAIKKCTSPMKNGNTNMNENVGKIKQ